MKKLDSFLLEAVLGLVFLLVNIVAIYLLLRGHNLPGGGFIGGLMTGMSFILLGLVRGWAKLQREMPVDPLRTAITGVSIALFTGLIPVFRGDPFLTQYNLHFEDVPLIGELHVGTPLLFDIGVFLLVGGMTVKLIIVLARSTSGLSPFAAEETHRYASILEDPIEDSVKRKDTSHAD